MRRSRLAESALIALAVAFAAPAAVEARPAPKPKPAEGRRKAIDLITEGMALEDAGNLKEAAARYEESISLAASPAAYYHLGRVLGQQGKRAEAIRQLQRALELSPHYELARVELKNLGATAPAPARVEEGGGNSERSGAVNVDALRREYETVRSMRGPGAMDPPQSAAGSDTSIQVASAGNAPGFISSAPQNANANSLPPISPARQGATDSYRRDAQMPPESAIIEYDSEVVEFDDFVDTVPRAEAGALASADGVRGVTVQESGRRPQRSPYAAGSQPPVSLGAVDGLDAGADGELIREQGGATGTAPGGMPPPDAINDVAFGPDAEAQKPSRFYGNDTEIFLGTYAFHKEKADSYRAAQRWKDAAVEYETALRLNGADVEARALYAEVLGRLGRESESEEQFRKALAQSPGDARIHYRRGVLYREQQKLDLAAGAFLQALRTDPQNKFARNNLGVVYMEKGEYANAARQFEQVVELDPNYEKAVLNLGIIYDDHLPDKAKALEYYQRYIDLRGERRSEVEQWIQSVRRSLEGAQ